MERAIKQYKPLGNKTLFMLIAKRSTFAYAFLIIFILLLISTKFIPANYTGILADILLTCLIVFVMAYLVAIFIGWLEYSHYGVFIEEENFTVAKGLFNEEERGIAYKFVQEVRIDRSISDQAFGVSTITVMVIGEAEGVPFSELTKIVLPVIEKNTASAIQADILNRVHAKKGLL